MSKMIYIAVLLTSLLATCNSIDSKIYFENELQPEKDLNDDPISHRVTTVALKLDRAFSAKNPLENVLFSPLSVASVISLLLLGAKGYTALELSEFLGVNHKARMNLDIRLKMLHEQFGHLLSSLVYKTDDSYELDTATGLFPQNTYPVKRDYLDRVENIYRSEILPVDYQYRNFDALAIINKWVANKTHDRITHLLAEPPAPETTIIIANALYFNGNWKYPFLKAATKRANFYVGKKPGILQEEVVDVDLMVNSADIPYLDDEMRDCQMIGLPYVGEEVYMYIILPNNNLEKFMKNLTENDLHSMIKSASNNTTVIFAIPKMKLDNNVDLTPTLHSLGLKTTFNPAQADFRNMADGVFVDLILHRVELEVDEIGTKASAATLGSTLKSGATPVVRVDRPFLFFIHHKTSDTILFWGKIIKPTPNYPAKSLKPKSRRLQ